ncbi:hypothetical protein EN780_35250, partial [Mesorhizobium sp. M4B.F.Ca.ET.089.01.1.1]|uniref:7-cyano-7-deazaguanine synthase n=1 Tax=Mesorhizobium sp. M4B.F.Ca.ET.089.01.1.1 TaxID=2496662 RepID=UPI000FF759A6
GDELVDLIRDETHTCYQGDRTHHHEWGCGCGQCPACELRAEGYRQFATLPATPLPTMEVSNG